MISRRLLLSAVRAARGTGAALARRPVSTTRTAARAAAADGGSDFRRPATDAVARRPDAGVPDDPRDWEPVTDEATGEIYYWNQHTDETTALGDPRPGSAADLRLREAHAVAEQQQHNTGLQGGPPQTLGQSMKQYFFLGIGISIAFMLVGKVFSEPLEALDAVDFATQSFGGEPASSAVSDGVVPGEEDGGARGR